MINLKDKDQVDPAELVKLNNQNDTKHNYNDDDCDCDDNCNNDNQLTENNLKNNNKLINNKNISNDDYEKQIDDEIIRLYSDMPLTDDTTCGFWILKASFLQRFANTNSYIIIFGLVGLIFAMAHGYYNGTITTIEKRFKISSRNSGIIFIGCDISELLLSAVISYFGGKAHRPRFMGFGVLTIILFCLISALPHFLYGPGEDALMLTKEYGTQVDVNFTILQEKQKSEIMCNKDDEGVACSSGDVNIIPQVLLFIGQFLSGVGSIIYLTLGVSYMDDNNKKSKTPALLSVSYFLRMLGPAFGLALASICLRIYTVPYLNPTIKNDDPRWLGAWWLGWFIICIPLIVFGLFLAMFPKQLPKAAARKAVENARLLQSATNQKEQEKEPKPEQKEMKLSLKNMLKTFKILLKNKVLMCNNISSIFYLFGYTPYWIFTPKYIEVQYRQSAATSNLVTGTVALVFSAIGVLSSGFIISKYKPRARYMAAWNVACGVFSVLGMVSYAFLGCPGNENSMVMNIPEPNLSVPTCNSMCQCDYVQYSPVCGQDGQTYISPCHAGCDKQLTNDNKETVYYNCACIPTNVFQTDGLIGEKLQLFLNSTSINEQNKSTRTFLERIKGSLEDLESTVVHGDSTTPTTILPSETLILLTSLITARDVPVQTSSLTQLPSTTSTAATTFLSQITDNVPIGGQAIPGACPVDCFNYFVIFLTVMCFLKFIGAAGRASNFLVAIRCVPEKDKAASLGFSSMLISLFAFIPSPIFFGWVLDSLCLVWGKTCSTEGNCWLYDAEALRYIMNFIASAFVFIGTLFDVGVWYYVKDLKIFDEEVKDIELKDFVNEEETTNEKKVTIK